MKRALALLLLSGCGTVGVYAPGLGDGVGQAIASGLPVHQEDDRAQVHVLKRDLASYLGGHAIDTVGCERLAHVKPDSNRRALVVAHEIGHLLGLGHEDDPKNLMYSGKLSEASDRLTRKQRKRARRAAAFLQICEVSK